MDVDSIVGTKSHSMLAIWGIESWWGQGFLHLSRPVLGPNQPPIQWVLCHSQGYGSINHSPQSNTKVKERLELYLYLPFVPSWQVMGNLCLYVTFYC